MRKAMARLIITLIVLFIFNGASNAEALSNELPKCIVKTHCVRIDWKVNNIDESFQKVLEAVATTPRTRIIEQSKSYIHAEATTKWMRYVDDLEIMSIPQKGILQIRSESRVGVGDNGVNKKRVDKLAYRLEPYLQK